MMTGETDVPGEKKNGFSAAWFTTNPTRTVVFVSTDVRKLLKKKYGSGQLPAVQHLYQAS
jgi:hypothetical protein